MGSTKIEKAVETVKTQSVEFIQKSEDSEIEKIVNNTNQF